MSDTRSGVKHRYRCTSKMTWITA